MAAGAVAYTGCTGEDYAVPFENAIVVETADPEEIARYAMLLLERPEDAREIRVQGREMAARLAWPHVVSNLATRLEFLGHRSGVLSSEGLSLPASGIASAASNGRSRRPSRPRRGAASTASQQELVEGR